MKQKLKFKISLTFACLSELVMVVGVFVDKIPFGLGGDSIFHSSVCLVLSDLDMSSHKLSDL